MSSTGKSSGSDASGQGRLRPGQDFGQYRILRLLGRGGMGEVYEAEHAVLRTRHALKLINPEVLEQSSAAERFKREAQVMAQLKHPHIVHVDEFGETGGFTWLRMELISSDGGSGLCRTLDDVLAEGKAVPPAKAAEWIRQMLEAVGCAHERGVVHRDLKPANVLVDDEDQIKITDFGLVSLAGEEWQHEKIGLSMIGGQTIVRDPGEPIDEAGSSTQAMLGSYEFMSPEQKAGKAADRRSDIYALGLIAYRMLSGQKTLGIEPPSHFVPGLDRRWDEWVMKALKSQPAARYASAAEMRTAMPTEPGPAGGPGGGKRGLAIGAAVLVVVAAVAVLVFGGLFESQPKPVDPGPADPVSPAETATHTLSIDPADASGLVWIGDLVSEAKFEQGRYTFDSLPAGTHELVVKAPGFETFVSTIEVGAGSGTHRIELSPVTGDLEIQSTPEASVSALSASGVVTELGVTDGVGYLMVKDRLRIGTYTIRIEKANYLTQEAQVTLESGRVGRVRLGLSAVGGRLRVFSVPEGAEILVDGKVQARTTPATLELPAGQAIAVAVRLAGYREETRTAELDPGATATMDFGRLIAENGRIQIRIQNEARIGRGAEQFRIDGEPVEAARAGEVIILESVGIGSRRLEVVHPNYQTWTGTVDVVAEQTTAVEVMLEPKPGVLTLELSPAGIPYVLSVNGKSQSRSPTDRYLLPAGEPLELRLQAKDYQEVRREVELIPNGSASLRIELQRYVGPVAAKDAVVSLPDNQRIQLLWLQGGTFEMGSPISERGRNDDEARHAVTLRNGFWLAQTELTQAQWRAVMGSNPSANRSAGLNAPVDSVSWADANAFCARLTELERAAGRLPEDYVYALPSEAQWEFACRAGTSSSYAGYLDDHAWYSGNSRGATHPVAGKRPNEWNLYDMHGNVFEWCADAYGPYPEGPRTDPLTQPDAGLDPSAVLRVIRGGSVDSSLRACRSASRLAKRAVSTDRFTGFRIALLPQR